jgi:hypothetical protein
MYRVFSLDGVEGAIPTYTDGFASLGVFVYFEGFEGNPVVMSDILDEGIPGCISVRGSVESELFGVLEDIVFVNLFEDVHLLGCDCLFNRKCSFSYCHYGECSNERVVIGGVDCCIDYLFDLDLDEGFVESENSSFTCDYCCCSLSHSVVYSFGDTSLCSSCYDRVYDFHNRLGEFRGSIVSFGL